MYNIHKDALRTIPFLSSIWLGFVLCGKILLLLHGFFFSGQSLRMGVGCWETNWTRLEWPFPQVGGKLPMSHCWRHWWKVRYVYFIDGRFLVTNESRKKLQSFCSHRNSKTIFFKKVFVIFSKRNTINLTKSCESLMHENCAKWCANQKTSNEEYYKGPHVSFTVAVTLKKWLFRTALWVFSQNNILIALVFLFFQNICKTKSFHDKFF